MIVGISIFHYLTDAETKRCIDEVSQIPEQLQCMLEPAEIFPIVLVDDGSPKPLEIQEGSDRRLLLLTNQTNLGYIKSANMVLQMLGGMDFMWVLNNDITGITEALLRDMLDELQRNEALAAVSPAISPNAHSSMHASQHGIALRYSNHIDFVCPLIRMKAWRDVGQFDEELAGFGVDVDWCYRARQKGWKFAVLPQHVVHHEMGASVRAARQAGFTTQHDDLVFMGNYLKQKHQVKDWRDLTI